MSLTYREILVAINNRFWLVFITGQNDKETDES